MKKTLKPNGSPSAQPASTFWRRRLFRSPLRCHLAGSVAALILTVAIADVWVRRLPLMTIRTNSPMLNVDHAAVTSQDREQLRWLHAATNRERMARQRIGSISQWLPKTLDEEQLRGMLVDAARRCGAEWVSCRFETTRQNDAVALTPVTCRLRGSFRSVYQVLEHLAASPYPLHCERIDVVREPTPAPKMQRSQDTPQDNVVLVTATLKLVAPHAGDRTLASRCLSGDVHSEVTPES